MAEFVPTPSQLEAMTLRGPALLVAAGAGSGKTRVLTERVLRAVCDPEAGAELDSFLVISFTRAAAAELRGRIMEALAARLAADPSNRRLRRQSAPRPLPCQRPLPRSRRLPPSSRCPWGSGSFWAPCWAFRSRCCGTPSAPGNGKPGPGAEAACNCLLAGGAKSVILCQPIPTEPFSAMRSLL